MNDNDERILALEAENARQSIELPPDAQRVAWSIGVMGGRRVTVAVRALRADGTPLMVKVTSKEIETIAAEERGRLERECDDAQGWLAWVTDRINEAARDAHVAEVEHMPSDEAWRVAVKHTLRHLAHKEAERYAAVRRGDEARADVARLTRERDTADERLLEKVKEHNGPVVCALIDCAVERVTEERDAAVARAERAEADQYRAYMALPLVPEASLAWAGQLYPHAVAVADEWAIRERQLDVERARVAELEGLLRRIAPHPTDGSLATVASYLDVSAQDQFWRALRGALAAREVKP